MEFFEGQIAAITGAGSGIGRALAQNLAKQGCHLSLSDIKPDPLAETAAMLENTGVQVTTRVLDTADREAVEDWARQVVTDHGGVNLLFNNAGVALGSTIEGVDYEDFHWIININFWGVVHGTKAFLPHIRETGQGHIINFSSVFGLTAQPGMSTYNASKFAVRGFTESLRQEMDILEPHISATCVHPGGIKTNIARDSREGDSSRVLFNQDPERAKRDFEKMLKTPPEKAARTILRGVRRNRRRVLIGTDAHIISAVARLFPAGYQRLMVAFLKSSARRAEKSHNHS